MIKKLDRDIASLKKEQEMQETKDIFLERNVEQKSDSESERLGAAAC